MTPATRPYRAPLRSRLGGVFFVLPGVLWLAIFFLVPLVLIFIVSLGTRDAAGHVSLANPNLDQYALAIRPDRLPVFGNSLRYAAITTILSLLIGYPIAYWISHYGGQRKALLLIDGDLRDLAAMGGLPLSLKEAGVPESALRGRLPERSTAPGAFLYCSLAT